MERSILTDLKLWKAKRDRKPLLLRGARQVGKTFVLKEFGRLAYARTHYLNFEEEPRLAALFEKDLKPSRILQEISFHLNASIDSSQDLLILDEIQSAPKALTSLKYFAEELPELSICSAGSLLGLHLGESAFPVGKVEFLTLQPLSFAEFLRGIGETRALKFLHGYDFSEPVPETVHDHLWERLKTYFVVGGLPETVLAYATLQEDPFQAMEAVRRKQRDLVTAYLADIAKHSGKINSMHIERVWSSVPAQLAKAQDGSSSKFGFKGVVPGVQGYARLAGAIDWLKAAGLLFKLPIVNKAWIPLSAHAEENTFKLYLFDVGLLGAMGGLAPKVLLDFTFGSYKGYVAENFALQEMSAAGMDGIASWRENTAELEFLLEREGALLPIEVKSGWVTQAKSLKVFAEKYRPTRRVTLSARNFSRDPGGSIRVPLYLASHLARLT